MPTNHGSIEFLKFPDPQHPGDTTMMIKKWLRDSWARRKIAALQTAIGQIAVPAASSAAPLMDGTAAAGSSTDYSRADHVHPSDTSRQASLSSAQLAAVNSGITATQLQSILSRLHALDGQ